MVQDNGAGMKHEDIPDMLGRVLSGTKFGVRQTRGKFGLGAKMALIWSKVRCLPACLPAASGTALASAPAPDLIQLSWLVGRCSCTWQRGVPGDA